MVRGRRERYAHAASSVMTGHLPALWTFVAWHRAVDQRMLEYKQNRIDQLVAEHVRDQLFIGLEKGRTEKLAADAAGKYLDAEMKKRREKIEALEAQLAAVTKERDELDAQYRVEVEANVEALNRHRVNLSTARETIARLEGELATAKHHAWQAGANAEWSRRERMMSRPSNPHALPASAVPSVTEPTGEPSTGGEA